MFAYFSEPSINLSFIELYSTSRLLVRNSVMLHIAFGSVAHTLLVGVIQLSYVREKLDVAIGTQDIPLFPQISTLEVLSLDENSPPHCPRQL